MPDKAWFVEPRIARDEYALEVWRKHGLGDHPSFTQMEKKAQELLSDPRTALDGMAMVLGRRIDAGEDSTLPLIVLDAGIAFGLLLAQCEIEMKEANAVRAA